MTDAPEIRQQLDRLSVKDANYAIAFVDLLLDAARAVRASDVHLQPTRDGLDVRWRLDGVLQQIGVFPRGDAADVVSRLKVLAQLLTYHSDRPQEGRIRDKPGDIEMRLSTFPTLHGERAVIRLFASQQRFQYLENLGFPPEIDATLRRLLRETSGALIISGPAGSGKTTTAYACLRELVRTAEGGKSVVSLEDPIEVAVDGVAQAQVNPPAGLNLATGLRSLLRQDPEAILVGEIRDREAAETVFQAALTGHVVVTTFHAGSAAVAISRLSDMGIEPYLLRSGTLAILNQRLVRRLCPCARPITDPDQLLGLPETGARQAVGCDTCRRTGYVGRLVLAELLVTDQSELGRAILSRRESSHLEQLAIRNGMVPVWQRALDTVRAGLTSPSEVRRTFGFGPYSVRAAE
ncbi:MAG: type II/IV secretion system protein [Planctomycetaceae bacterium]|nr:type II/IV secretion system protein [Planctomycetaceae bacterium]